jgi:hypothetical protein
LSDYYLFLVLGLNLLFILGIPKSITGVENGDVVDVLNIALLEICRYAETLTQEMQGVQSFGLGFGDGWEMVAAGESSETNVVTTGVLEHDSFWGLAIGAGGLMVNQRATGNLVGVIDSLCEAVTR